jgi:hypothetical protein
MLRIAIVLAGLCLLAACGDDDDGDDGAPPAAGNPPTTELTVTVWPAGPDRPKQERRVECPGDPVCEELSTASFAPVPGNMACTAIYGGPSVARVEGTLRGRPVDERFSLEDGCQIARWKENRALLGPPGNAP